MGQSVYEIIEATTARHTPSFGELRCNPKPPLMHRHWIDLATQ
jgi:hypothetical protein